MCGAVWCQGGGGVSYVVWCGEWGVGMAWVAVSGLGWCAVWGAGVSRGVVCVRCGWVARCSVV